MSLWQIYSRHSVPFYQNWPNFTEDVTITSNQIYSPCSKVHNITVDKITFHLAGQTTQSTP